MTATLPFKVPISSIRLSRTCASEPEWPGHQRIGGIADHRQHAFIAQRAIAVSSVTSPSSGSGSIFQSPVWTIRPSGVRIASQLGSRIEWVIEMKSIWNGPSFSVPPSGTCLTLTRSCSPASSSLPSISRR